MSPMSGEYLECQNCGFVLLAESPGTTKPKNRDACPNCDGTVFTPIDNEP